MSSSPAMAPDVKKMDHWEGKLPGQERVPAWELECIPRLDVDDLLDPAGFHRRLADWLMTQK